MPRKQGGRETEKRRERESADHHLCTGTYALEFPGASPELAKGLITAEEHAATRARILAEI